MSTAAAASSSSASSTTSGSTTSTTATPCPVCQQATCTTPGMGLGVLIGLLVLFGVLAIGMRVKLGKDYNTLAGVGGYSIVLAIILGALIKAGKACS